jgi:hypothetical protein
MHTRVALSLRASTWMQFTTGQRYELVALMKPSNSKGSWLGAK